ncbi:hypothetical protein BLA50215_01288 [Burkholderia lata]|nr:hypothetical protein BLA50215_01288 [Burkholderia lata]
MTSAAGGVPACFIALNQGFRIDTLLMRRGDGERDSDEPGRGRVRSFRTRCDARIRFVAGVTGWEYRAMGADSILLFYEPASRVALLTFDWS